MSNHMNHVVICGYASGAALLLDALTDELSELEAEVFIFAAGERPQRVPPQFKWIQGDPTKESELDKVSMGRASAVLVVGSRDIAPQQADAITILTTFTIRSYLASLEQTAKRAKPLYIVAEILDAENVKHARAAGADEVIETTRLGYSLLAHAIAIHGTGEILEAMARSGANNLYLGRHPKGIDLPLSFDEVSDLVKKAHGAMVIGVHDERTHEDILNPQGDFQVTDDHCLIYLAEQRVLSER